MIFHSNALAAYANGQHRKFALMTQPVWRSELFAEIGFELSCSPGDEAIGLGAECSMKALLSPDAALGYVDARKILSLVTASTPYSAAAESRLFDALHRQFLMPRLVGLPLRQAQARSPGENQDPPSLSRGGNGGCGPCNVFSN